MLYRCVIPELIRGGVVEEEEEEEDGESPSSLGVADDDMKIYSLLD